MKADLALCHVPQRFLVFTCVLDLFQVNSHCVPATLIAPSGTWPGAENYWAMSHKQITTPDVYVSSKHSWNHGVFGHHRIEQDYTRLTLNVVGYHDRSARGHYGCGG